MQSRFVRRLLMSLLAAALLPAVASATVEVEGYARETLPGSHMSAAYLTLRNAGATTRQLRRIALPNQGGAVAELHTTIEDAGISRMRPLEQLPIPAGGEVRMAPGGVHLMLRDLSIRAGTVLKLRLHFADGAVVDVRVPVRKPQAAAQHAHH